MIGKEEEAKIRDTLEVKASFRLDRLSDEIALSQAISLKRIADRLDYIALQGVPTS